MKAEVLISYAWPDPKKTGRKHTHIVDQISKTVESNNFKVTIDKKDLKYKGDIKKFEERIGRGDKVILVVCNKFLRSKHCMYEVLKIHEKGNIQERIFPVVLKDANIYNPNGAIEYIKHWEKESEKLSKKMKTLKSQAHLAGLREEIDNYTKYREIIADIIKILSNMNTLSPEQHQDTNFEELISMLKDNKISIPTTKEQEFSYKVAETKKLYESSIAIVSKELKNQDGSDKDILTRFKYWHTQCVNETFQIGVMAMVKSGKSSFLNSLLGDEFLPMSNVPETAVPVKIIHSNSEETMLEVSKNKKIFGTNEINKYLLKKNKNQRQKGSLNSPELKLHANLIVLDEIKMSNIKFEILDTPGFGEALEEVIRGKSIEESNAILLDRISVVIYVLDYTKLKTQEEKEVLQKLATIRPDILEKIQDRLFLIINKIDTKDRNGLPADKTTDYVYNLVKPKMPKLQKKQIFQISASRALLSRLILNGTATDKARQDFATIAFGESADEMKEDDYKRLARQILVKSNINQVENELINFIYNERGRIFIETLLDKLKLLLQEFKNKYILTAKGTLTVTVEEIEALEEKINAAKKKQESILEEANKFENYIKTWIDNEFGQFEKKIQDDIDSVFNVEKADHKTRWYNLFMPAWATELQKRITSIFHASTSSSKQDIETKVYKLNQDISSQLKVVFENFRKELEIKISNKQKELLTSLEGTINTLAREFEGTLQKALKINLETIELKLNDILDFQKMQADANSLIQRFITAKSRVDTVRKERKIKHENSWCWPDTVETKVYYVPETTIEYSISKTGVEIYWKNSIAEKNANAKKMMNHIIESEIKKQIRSARKSFDDYADEYLEIIHAEKNRKSSGNVDIIKSRIDALDNLDKHILKLMSAISKLST